MNVEELAIKHEQMDEGELLSKAIATIERSQSHGVVVTRGGALRGTVDDRCLRDFAGDATQTKLSTILATTTTATAATTPEELVTMFLETHSRIIPFSRGGAVTGVITRPSVMRLLIDAPLLKNRKVHEFSSPKPVISEHATIEECRNKMRDLGTFHLAVAAANGTLEGIVSSYDVCIKVLPELNQPANRKTAYKLPHAVLSQNVTAITKSVPSTVMYDAPLADACRKMAEDNVSALVVVDEANRPFGLLTVRDALHAVLKPSPEPVFVYGLRDDEKAFTQSLREMAAAFLEKVGRKTHADYLAIHVKSVQEGVKRRYAIKAKLSVNGKLYTAGTKENITQKESWDLRLSVKTALEELDRMASSGETKPRDLKRKATREELQ